MFVNTINNLNNTIAELEQSGRVDIGFHTYCRTSQDITEVMITHVHNIADYSALEAYCFTALKFAQVKDIKAEIDLISDLGMISCSISYYEYDKDINKNIKYVCTIKYIK